eukprot:TRINITY_DN2401_c0_g1_i2.p1 TRINITY_DN2401_c0_g1~~TRINITY_DN2401_c0_g1_i2.p1  ORF type:complete len:227 (-),score=42.61 TRINITY_DN2401_c0_g1_i2:20-700(-)
MKELNDDLASSQISFHLDKVFFYVSKYATIAAYSQSSPKWYNELQALKNLYAYSPKTHLNIFVTDQKAGSAGTLLGIGTFPWDNDYLSAVGGLWVNGKYFGAGHKTVSHELGHNLGLWHTFHGVDEVQSCSVCYELPHDTTDPQADHVGDFCSDTRSTPRNYQCNNPTGNACNSVSWTKYGTDLDNIMGYTPDNCMNSFSEQQGRRAHCYLCSTVSSILSKNSICQ